jgi:hypothetical protein
VLSLHSTFGRCPRWIFSTNDKILAWRASYGLIECGNVVWLLVKVIIGPGAKALPYISLSFELFRIFVDSRVALDGRKEVFIRGTIGEPHLGVLPVLRVPARTFPVDDAHDTPVVVLDVSRIEISMSELDAVCA